MVEGPGTHHIGSGGTAILTLPHPWPWAGPGRGTNRSGLWAPPLPQLPSPQPPLLSASSLGLTLASPWRRPWVWWGPPSTVLGEEGDKSKCRKSELLSWERPGVWGEGPTKLRSRLGITRPERWTCGSTCPPASHAVRQALRGLSRGSPPSGWGHQLGSSLSSGHRPCQAPAGVCRALSKFHTDSWKVYLNK